MSATRVQPFFTTANLLSLARVPLAGVFAVVLVAPWGGAWAALAALAVAGLTDALDGMFARRTAARLAPGDENLVLAGTGSWLDPICDKVFVSAVLAAIWFHHRPPVSLLGLILARELAQLPLSLIYAAIPTLRRWLRYDFRASFFGKAATIVQFAAIVALLFQSAAARLAAWASFVVGLVALADYVRRAIRVGRDRVRDGAGSGPLLERRDTSGSARRR